MMKLATKFYVTPNFGNFLLTDLGDMIVNLNKLAPIDGVESSF